MSDRRQKPWGRFLLLSAAVLGLLLFSGCRVHVLPFDDKASPEVIAGTFGLSKAAFKRAVGHLMKEGLLKKENGKLHL